MKMTDEESLDLASRLIALNSGASTLGVSVHMLTKEEVKYLIRLVTEDQARQERAENGNTTGLPQDRSE